VAETSFQHYLAGRMSSTGTTDRALAEALVYRDATGVRHPTPQAVRNWRAGTRPRAELVTQIARHFGDSVNDVRRLAQYEPIDSQVALPNPDEMAAAYRDHLAAIPPHIPRLAHRMALAAIDAAASAD
jgi:hypothetical protein